jgi:hypothetical protein
MGRVEERERKRRELMDDEGSKVAMLMKYKCNALC